MVNNKSFEGGTFRRLTEFFVKFLIIVLGCCCLCVGIYMIVIAFRGSLVHIFLALPFLAIFGYIFGSGVGSIIGGYFGRGLYYPRDKYRIPQVRFSVVRSKIVKGDFDEAIEDLEVILNDFPGDPVAVRLLAEVFMDKTCDFHNAHGLLGVYLQERQRPTPDDVDLVMMFVDVSMELDLIDDACLALQCELQKKYPTSDMTAIKLRLESLL